MGEMGKKKGMGSLKKEKKPKRGDGSAWKKGSRTHEDTLASTTCTHARACVTLAHLGETNLEHERTGFGRPNLASPSVASPD